MIAETERARLIDAARAYIDALDAATVPNETRLPGEHLFTSSAAPHMTVRVRPMYNDALAIEWGPRYINTETPELDADSLEINGKEYDHVHVVVTIDDDGTTIYDSWSSLTESARRKVRPLALALAREWVDAETERASQWTQANTEHARNYALDKKAQVARDLLKALDA